MELLREIAMSNAWQRSSLPNESNQRDRRHFSHAIPRRLPAEILYDGIKQVLCANDEQDTIREDLTRRAVGHLSMRMAGTYVMHVFGKPERAVTCDCERVNKPSLLLRDAESPASGMEDLLWSLINTKEFLLNH